MKKYNIIYHNLNNYIDWFIYHYHL